MSQRARHYGRVGLLGFGAISAIAGSIGLVGGGLDDALPAGMLDRTPFSSYRVPGLILGGIVGGTQLIALGGVVQRRSWATPATGLAGCVMMGWIVGEVLLIGSEPGVMRNLQVTYLVDGLLDVLLAA